MRATHACTDHTLWEFVHIHMYVYHTAAHGDHLFHSFSREYAQVQSSKRGEPNGGDAVWNCAVCGEDMMSCANRCRACNACAFLEKKHGLWIDQDCLQASRALELIQKDSACQIVARED
jgi:hypothetical protein